MFERNQTKATDTRLTWIEPKIEELHVNETAANASSGHDGGTSPHSLRGVS